MCTRVPDGGEVTFLGKFIVTLNHLVSPLNLNIEDIAKIVGGVSHKGDTVLQDCLQSIGSKERLT